MGQTKVYGRMEEIDSFIPLSDCHASRPSPTLIPHPLCSTLIWLLGNFWGSYKEEDVIETTEEVPVITTPGASLSYYLSIKDTSGDKRNSHFITPHFLGTCRVAMSRLL